MPLKIVGTAPGFEDFYHFHAIAKYRKSVFTNSIAKRTETLISEKSSELGWSIVDIATDNDHLHFLIKADSTPSNIAFRLFGYSSYMLRKEFPELKELHKDQFWAGEQCNCITDNFHYENTLIYIKEHKTV